VEQEQTHLMPFSDTLADELSEAGGMLQFLMYEYGLNLNDTLKSRMAEAEQKDREEQIIRKERRIAQLKKKLENKEQSPEEYILELENHIRLLESDNRRIPAMKARIEELTEQNERSQEQILELTEQSRAAQDSIVELKIVQERERTAMREDYEDRIYQTITAHESAKNVLREACNRKIRQTEESLSAEREVFEQRLLDIGTAHEKEMQSLKDSVLEGEQALEQLTRERDEIAEQKLVCEARIKALRASNNEEFDENAFTDMDDFNELERELDAFVRFYDERWGITKKAIRKKLLSYQSLKGKSGKK
jgi:chromosome segregation ATPase